MCRDSWSSLVLVVVVVLLAPGMRLTPLGLSGCSRVALLSGVTGDPGLPHR